MISSSWESSTRSASSPVRVVPSFRGCTSGGSNLGIEYALSDDQGAIDALVNGRTWDEAAARRIIFDWVVTWGFQEYIDIFKSAWRLNRGLPAGAPPFRIVGLSVRQSWQYLSSEKDARNPQTVLKIFSNGIPDAHMAEIIDREFVRTGEKALVFCGSQHAFTAYRSPEYQKSAEELKLAETRRAGNIVFAEIGSRAFSVSLHAPWPDPGSRTGLAWPADGVIDALIDALPPEKRSAGFDTAGSPLGALPVTSGGYARSAGSSGAAHLRMEDLFDGYVILGPLSGYRAVTPIPGFVLPQDAATALQQFPGAKPPSLTAEQANTVIADDAAAVDKLLALFR